GGEVLVEAGLLWQVTEAAADGDPAGGVGGVVAEDAQAAGVGRQHGCEHAQQGGLAGSVGAQQPGDAGAEVERHPVDGASAPVRLGDVGDADAGPTHNALLTSSAARRRTSTRAETATATRHPTWPAAWKAAKRSSAAPALAATTAIHTAVTTPAAASGVSHVARARLAKVSPREGSSQAAAVQSRPGTSTVSVTSAQMASSRVVSTVVDTAWRQSAHATRWASTDEALASSIDPAA